MSWLFFEYEHADLIELQIFIGSVGFWNHVDASSRRPARAKVPQVCFCSGTSISHLACVFHFEFRYAYAAIGDQSNIDEFYVRGISWLRMGVKLVVQPTLIWVAELVAHVVGQFFSFFKLRRRSIRAGKQIEQRIAIHVKWNRCG